MHSACHLSHFSCCRLQMVQLQTGCTLWKDANVWLLLGVCLVETCRCFKGIFPRSTGPFSCAVDAQWSCFWLLTLTWLQLLNREAALVDGTVCSNFEFPAFSTVWMGHILFSCLESDTKILPPRFLPTKIVFSYQWIGPIGTCALHYLPPHSVFLFRIGYIGPSFPQLTLLLFYQLYFFRHVESSQQTLSALSEWAKRSLWQVRAFLWPGLHIEHQKGFLRVSFFLMNSLNTFVL